jgi:TM2 domain-containing membrane protein YozV
MTTEQLLYALIIIGFLILLFIQIHIFHREQDLRFDELYTSCAGAHRVPARAALERHQHQ